MVETVKDCHYPWTWMMVTSDGEVKPCCFSSESLGNLNDKSIDQIWNGPTAIALRKCIKGNKIHELCAAAPCKFVQNMQIRPVRGDAPQLGDEPDGIGETGKSSECSNPLVGGCPI